MNAQGLAEQFIEVYVLLDIRLILLCLIALIPLYLFVYQLIGNHFIVKVNETNLNRRLYAQGLASLELYRKQACQCLITDNHFIQYICKAMQFTGEYCLQSSSRPYSSKQYFVSCTSCMTVK
jgi:hypothetical protein